MAQVRGQGRSKLGLHSCLHVGLAFNFAFLSLLAMGFVLETSWSLISVLKSPKLGNLLRQSPLGLPLWVLESSHDENVAFRVVSTCLSVSLGGSFIMFTPTCAPYVLSLYVLLFTGLFSPPLGRWSQVKHLDSSGGSSANLSSAQTKPHL